MTVHDSPGPFESDEEVRVLPAVRAVYDEMRASSKPGVMTVKSTELITEAMARAGAEMGDYDDRIAAWIGNFGPVEAMTVALWISRAAAAQTAKGGGR